MISFWGDCPRCRLTCYCPDPPRCDNCGCSISFEEAQASDERLSPPLCDQCSADWCDDCADLHEPEDHAQKEIPA